MTSRHIATGARTALGALIFFVTMGACTEVDDRLGSNMVPKNQRMEIEVTSPEGGVKTYLYREDSVPSSRTGSAWFGKTIDARFGTQVSGVLLQFLPYSLPYSKAEGYGIDPIVDSARILFTLTGTRGDTTALQRFDVWEVDDSRETVKLHRDSTYYANFPAERFKGKKLFEFTHTGKRNVAARLFPTAAGKEFLYKIVSLKGDEWKYYVNDSLFHLKFRGLYITPADSSEPDAALYGADLAASGFQLYVRNHDTLDVSAIYDTITTLFTFSDTNATSTSEDDDGEETTTTWANVSVNMTDFKYAGSELGILEQDTDGFTDTVKTPLKKLYVQSMGGVGTYLRFTDELIETIRNLRFKTDETGQKVGKDIAINQAMMRIWLEDDSTETMDGSIARMGSYLNMQTLTPIPDYQYLTEKYQNQTYQQQGSTETYTLPYNGYLNRSNGYYELDITSYVQGLAKVKESDPAYQYMSPAIFLAPEAYGIIGAGQSVLKGYGSENPVFIRITYTIIEG